MIYTISNEILTVQVNTLGGELISVKKDGKERLWQNENGGWAGHAPVLFPVCGDCTMIVRGKEYPIKKHGFARNSEFELQGINKTELTMQNTYQHDRQQDHKCHYHTRYSHDLLRNQTNRG